MKTMIAAAGFRPDRVNTDIVERHFPLDREGAYDASGLELFGGDREYSINDVEATIKPKGGRLEGLVRGLAYLKANPDALKDGPVVFPASSWVKPEGGVYIPYADKLGDDEPRLLLLWGGRDRRWGWFHRFLVSGK